MAANQSSFADDGFALPENLQQYFVVAPCKLRLVALLIFVMSRYKVSLYFNFSILTFNLLSLDSDK